MVIQALQDKEFIQIQYISKNDCRLLPFNNFYIQQSCSIEKAYMDSSFLIKKNTITPIKHTSFKGKIFLDHRDLIFEPAKELHGSTDIKNSNNTYEIVHSLAGMYRFGSPIIAGFHYHAQRKNNNSLNGVTFYCAKENAPYVAPTSCNYLNITPNDMIRE